MSKDAYYFPHDANARNDQRLLRLRMEMGAAGVGIFWMVAEMMAEASDGFIPADSGTIAFALSLPKDEVDKFLKIAIHEGLLFEQDGKLGSRRMMEYKERRGAIRQVRSRSGSLGGEANVKQMLDKRQANAKQVLLLKERKGKDSKVKDRKGDRELTGPEALLSLWNDGAPEGIQKAAALNNKRTTHCLARLAEHPMEKLAEAVARVRASSFCLGLNDRGWRANFDWFLRPSTLMYINEGRYDDRKPGPGKQVGDSKPTPGKYAHLEEESFGPDN